MKKWTSLLEAAGLTAISTLALLSTGLITGNAEQVIHQHSSALNYYSSRGYSDVYNHGKATHYSDYSGETPNWLKSNSGKYVNFHHYMDIDVDSPQSIIMNPNKNIFVASNDYDGRMNVVRYQGNHHQNVKAGPTFRGGHGQSMSYNPQNHQIWLVGNKSGASQHSSNVQEISPYSLRPLRKINFSFGQSIISSNLAFDKRGNAYTYTITGGGFAPAGSVKLYKGRITDHSVKFHLVKQGIRHAPGETPQAMSYNPKNDRLYLVSDGEIISFPAKKIGHLSKRDVSYSKFPGRLEFEGLTFDHSGHGYLLLHGEIMRSTRVF